jgi:hypothetical protein
MSVVLVEEAAPVGVGRVARGLNEVADPDHVARGLEEAIAEVCGLLNATTARLVDLIAQVLTTGAWMGAGIRSAEQWVAWQCGVSPRRARALVAMATRLPSLPSTTAAFTTGELSEDQTGVVCRYTQPHNDTEVAELARHATVSQLQRTLRDHRPTRDPEPTDTDGQPPPPEPRRLTFGYDDDNTWSMNLKGPTDEGALIETALTQARQDLYNTAEDDTTRNHITWLDALLHICERSLDFHTTLKPRRDRYLTLLHLRHDPHTTPCTCTTNTGARTSSGSAADTSSRPTPDTSRPTTDGSPAPGSTPNRSCSCGAGRPYAYLHGGPALPDSLRRSLTCDGHIRPIHEIDGLPVNVGRTQRSVPYRTRTLIEDRDRGCRVPGCNRHRFLHIHHITHWEDGGPTTTDNLIALCPRHHRQHHQGHLAITGNPDQPNGITFTDHKDRPLPASGKPTPPTNPPDQTAQHLHIQPGHYTHPTGERLDTRWISLSDPPTPN